MLLCTACVCSYMAMTTVCHHHVEGHYTKLLVECTNVLSKSETIDHKFKNMGSRTVQSFTASSVCRDLDHSSSKAKVAG